MPDKRKRHINFGDGFAARDNTRTRFIPERGFISDIERENHPGDVDITDNPMGWMPIAGDVLQAGQAMMDLGSKNYRRAALNAGLLLLPNIIEKPAKGLLRGLRVSSVPYKGKNFMIHGTDYLDDVLRGETRAMSPSYAVGRIDELGSSGAISPFYEKRYFLGDKDMLDNGLLFNGDAMTPDLMQVWFKSGYVPSSERAKVAEDLWQETLKTNGSSGLIINPDALETLPTPSDIPYFEFKNHGLVPLEKSKHALFPVPETKKDLDIENAFRDMGLGITRYENESDKIAKLKQIYSVHPEWLRRNGGLISRLQKHYNSPGEIRDAINQARINKYAKGGRKYDRNSKTDAGDLYYDIVRQRRNSAFGALLRSGETPENAARLAPLITTQQTMEGGWRLNRKDNNYGGMRASGKTIAFDSEDAFQDAYLKMLDSKWHTGRAAENSWRSAQDLDDWARILNREDLGLHTEADWNAYNKGRKGNDFVYLYAPEWENNNKPYREHLRKTKDLTKMYLDMLDKDEPYSSLVPMPEYELPEVTVTPQSNAQSKPVLFNSLIPASVMGMINNREDGGLLLKDYRSGGKIHIKPENRGKFTALKKRTGHSASWFKAHGTPAQKKMAVFALNAKKWKHGDGGIIDRLNQHTGGDPAKMLELIQRARKG